MAVEAELAALREMLGVGKRRAGDRQQQQRGGKQA
jgi:hypothetical protein